MIIDDIWDLLLSPATNPERLLFLKGDVNMKAAGDVERITEPGQMLAKTAQMEENSAKAYNGGALECAANADCVSKQLFEQLVQDEEKHFDEFDKQRDNIERFGLSYLALQSFNKAPEAPIRPEIQPGIPAMLVARRDGFDDLSRNAHHARRK